MYSLLVVLVLVDLAVSHPLLEDARIVGGEDVDIRAVPYQASLLRRGSYTCGCTIISNDLVLTAAHCVVGSKPQEYTVRVGSSFSSRGGQIYPVGDFVWHPAFTFRNMESDVALIWLARPMRFSEKIKPIEMFGIGEEIKEGEITVVTGWGSLLEGGGVPTQLQMVKVPIVSPEVCNDAYAPLYTISPTMICAGVPEGGLDACQGDSGGPLTFNGKLAGVVSWGLGCARPNYPGVYAKVSALRKWIDEQTVTLRMKHILRTPSDEPRL
ncbi:vitellin-degrading protease-like [Aricia agestis]|uniref:vitellin-degrading protease-like n=1 Tax=Aricia agestis TaxID=91739 RepID=UPI001C207356|nr:vitellin-degrading protease-like [Aricia agestis]